MKDKNIKRVLTGQQLGLLGGPLYTTYKVLGALKLSKEIYGRAIYWLETNDADFNEINHIDYLDSSGKLRTLKWDIDSKGYSCGSIEVDEKLTDILEEFFSSITQTEYTGEIKKIAMESYLPGKSLGEASSDLAHRLFEGFDLEIFDPSDEEFRQFTRPILLKEANRTKNGFQCNLFFMDGKKRIAIFKKGEGYVSREGNRINLNDFILVPSLRTRSICQDSFFSTFAYVAGPGEVKYLTELIPDYKFHNVTASGIVPRMSVDIVEPVSIRILKKLGLEIRDLDRFSVDEMKNLKLTELTGFDKKNIQKKSGEYKNEFVENLKNLGLETSGFNREIADKLKELIGKKRREAKEKGEVILRHVETIYNLLRPFGKRQERVFNIFYYMNLFGGRDLIKRMYKNYDNSLDSLEIKNV
ncbi:MAG: bacillithiol biosynthesis BshC [Acidobacteriota bacterium]